MLSRLAAIVTLAVLPVASHAALVRLLHPYGELIDQDGIAARVLHPLEVQVSSTFAVLFYGPLDNPHDNRAARESRLPARSA